MSRTARFVSIGVAVVIAVVAVVLLRPESGSDGRPTIRRPAAPAAETDSGRAGRRPSPRPRPRPRPRRPRWRSPCATTRWRAARKRIEVEKGDTVRLLVRSDAQDEIHVHGYDLYGETGPGQAGALQVQGEARGRVRDRGAPGRPTAGLDPADRPPRGHPRLIVDAPSSPTASAEAGPTCRSPSTCSSTARRWCSWCRSWRSRCCGPSPSCRSRRFRPLPPRVLGGPAERAGRRSCAVRSACSCSGWWSGRGLTGVQTSTANFAPTFVYVIFWLGLVPVSVVFGDVFRAFNPWRAIGTAGLVGGAHRGARARCPAPLSYPERLGRWPAAAGIFAFATLELVSSNGDQPETVAIAALVYSAATFVAMALYGVEEWCERGEAFGVYFNLFSRISPVTRRGDQLGLRPPLSGPRRSWSRMPGTVALLAVMIGSITFDGASEAPVWTNLSPDISSFFSRSRALARARARGGVPDRPARGDRASCTPSTSWASPGRGAWAAPSPREQLAGAFVHSLVPIALAYAAAHYLTLLAVPGPGDLVPGVQPARRGGHGPVRHRHERHRLQRDRRHGHLVLAGGLRGARPRGGAGPVPRPRPGGLHEPRAARGEQSRLAVRSQYWMLVVMVLFTTLALLLLSQANA